MKKFRIFTFILTICLIFSAAAPAAEALDDPPLSSAKAVVLADMESGRLLWSLNAQERRAPASLTKIMTVLLAVEALEDGRFTPDEMVTAQADCLAGLDTDSSTSDIKPGEIISYRDLLYCAMVHSANEACNILAHHIAGSVSAFVEMMNARAAELGCSDTHFSDPNGLSNENHYTTAYDMYLMTAEALRHPLFAEICNTRSYEMAATNLSDARSFPNSNALISNESDYGDKYLYSYAAGVKTGFTQLAGYCLVSTAENEDGERLLAVVMGCNGYLNSDSPDYENFTDTIKLYNWAFDNFSYRTVASSATTVTRVHVDLASESDENVNLRVQSDVTMLLPNDLDLDAVRLEPTVYEDMLKAPIPAGTVLGRAEIIIDGESRGSVNLVNMSEVELSKKEFMRLNLAQTLSSPWVKLLIGLVAFMFIGYLVLVIRYRVMRRRYLRRKREAARRRAERARSSAERPREDTQRIAAIVDEETGKR